MLSSPAITADLQTKSPPVPAQFLESSALEIEVGSRYWLSNGGYLKIFTTMSFPIRWTRVSLTQARQVGLQRHSSASIMKRTYLQKVFLVAAHWQAVKWTPRTPPESRHNDTQTIRTGVNDRIDIDDAPAAVAAKYEHLTLFGAPTTKTSCANCTVWIKVRLASS